MRRVGAVTICGQTYDLATDSHAEVTILARVGTDIYDRPVAVEVDLETEAATHGNIAMIEALIARLAEERDAHREEADDLAGKLQAALAAARRDP